MRSYGLQLEKLGVIWEFDIPGRSDVKDMSWTCVHVINEMYL